MSNISKKKKIIFIIVIALIVIFGIVEAYKINNSKLLNTKEYKELVSTVETSLEGVTTKEQFCSFISSWSKKNNVQYSADAYGNIIFHRDAIESKENVDPTVVCVSYNCNNLTDSVMPIASALSIAKSGISAEEYTVIIVNNDCNQGYGYKNLSKKYFPDNANVIFLDYGDESYISRSSFGASNNSVKIPMKMVSSNYDSGIKVSITGIATNNIGDNINAQPSPINQLSNILSKLKAKSISYQITDLSVVDNGNMYPSGITFTILLDSYSLETMTTYIDGKIEKFEKSYKKDFPDATYSYTVLDKASLPSTAYSESAADNLNTLIYTIKNSAYRFDSDNVPEGSKVGDVYAINCITDITPTSSGIFISMFTEGINKAYLNQVLSENATAAEMASSTASVSTRISPFKNSSNELSKSMTYSFFKSNHSWSSPQMINEKTDDFFTECSYIQNLNANMEIIHLRSKESLMDEYTNTLLYFIAVQGNFLSL